MRSFFVSMPPNDGPQPKVLLYLHGVGEAFNPIDDNDKAKLPERKLVPRLGAKTDSCRHQAWIFSIHFGVTTSAIRFAPSASLGGIRNPIVFHLLSNCPWYA